MMESPDLTVYVAEVDGEVVGTATTMVMPNVTYDCAPTAFVEAVVVVPAHRRSLATAAMPSCPPATTTARHVDLTLWIEGILHKNRGN